MQREASQLRSIPTCAGEPQRTHSGCLRGWVYPHVCGGTAPNGGLIYPIDGLSPRVRGNPLSRLSGQASNRSIPTCAGEPAIQIVRPSIQQVYPHVCGGTLERACGGIYRWGLSPRVRGNPIPNNALTVHEGSIPTCAGEPSTMRSRTGIRPVYPHVCGGTVGTPWAVMTAMGLSPRVRGNLFPVPMLCRCNRSIPTCAGEPTR